MATTVYGTIYSMTDMCDDLERAVYGDVQVRRGETAKDRWTRLVAAAGQKIRGTGG